VEWLEALNSNPSIAKKKKKGISNLQKKKYKWSMKYMKRNPTPLITKTCNLK
jgi:hypothetical protein